MRTVLVRIVPLFAALSVILGGVAAAQYPEPSQSVAVEGDTATVEGSGCDPDAAVAWTLHSGSTANSAAVDSGNARADGQGTYRFSMDVSDRHGRHTVRTQCSDLVQETSFNAGAGGRPQQSNAPETPPGQQRNSETRVQSEASPNDSPGGDRVVPLSSVRLAFSGGDTVGLTVRGIALLVAAGLLAFYWRRSRSRLASS